jgi:hypothetical protein
MELEDGVNGYANSIFVYANGAISDPCGFGISAHRMQVALEVDATPSSSLDWGGVGGGILAFVELRCT